MSQPLRVNVYKNQESAGYWAASPDIDGLTVAGDTREEVIQEARVAAETLLGLQGVRQKPNLVFADAEYQEE